MRPSSRFQEIFHYFKLAASNFEDALSIMKIQFLAWNGFQNKPCSSSPITTLVYFQVFHDVLEMREPRFEYNFIPQYLRPWLKEVPEDNRFDQDFFVCWLIVRVYLCDGVILKQALPLSARRCTKRCPTKVLLVSGLW